MAAKASEFEVSAGPSADTTTLKLHGPLLIAHVPAFRAAAYAVHTPALLLDFAGSGYMDSAGLGAVLQLHKDRTAHGNRLILTGLDLRIAALLKLTHADTVLEIHPGVQGEAAR